MKVLIQSPVEHDGKALREGETVDMPDDQAQALIDASVAVEVLKDVKPAKGKKDE